MLAVTNLAIPDRPPARHHLPAAETSFYSTYDWSLDPHLTVSEAVERLRSEIDRLATTAVGWQTHEVTTNVYLLSCFVAQRYRRISARAYAAAARTVGENPTRGVSLCGWRKVAENLRRQKRA